MSKIEDLMNEKGLTRSQAKYALEKSRGASVENYKPRPRKEWKASDLEELGIVIKPWCHGDINMPDWVVTQKDHGVRPLFVNQGTKYKNRESKYYWKFTYFNKEGDVKTMSLAQGIWLSYLKKDIPQGYVVDHIDNDPFNNCVNNLQLLTIRQNIEKNPPEKFKKISEEM